MRDVYQNEVIGRLLSQLAKHPDQAWATALAGQLRNTGDIAMLTPMLQLVVNTLAATVAEVGSWGPECNAVIRARNPAEEQRACRALAKAVNDSLDAALYGVPDQGAMWREVARRYTTMDAGMADQFLGLLGYPRDNLGVGLEWHVAQQLQRDANNGAG